MMSTLQQFEEARALGDMAVQLASNADARVKADANYNRAVIEVLF